jgi:tyramine---L-glutamate ligase
VLLFVYEFLCGGGLVGAEISPSLHREGWTMLDAVLRDLGRCPGMQTTTLLDSQQPSPATDWPNNTPVYVAVGEEPARFVELARRADYTLVIAPEFDDLLLTRCRWVVECGGRLLGPGVEAVRLTGDKLRLAEHLRSRGVATPATVAWSWTDNVAAFPAVVKPRYGAGSQATFLCRTPAACQAAAAAAREEGWHGEMIAQSYCEGLAASVAFLIGREECLALPAAAQHLSTEGRFRYQGGAVPLPPVLAARAQRLGQRAVTAVDGLFGYVGVDVVLGTADDGRDDVVIEINPRLTTSYAGLRQLACFNLAEALLAVTLGTPRPALAWREGPVHFRADGG